MSTERKVAKLKTWLAMFSSIAYNQRLDGVRGPHNQEASNIFCALIRICNYLNPQMDPGPNTRLLDVAGGTGDIAFRFMNKV